MKKLLFILLALMTLIAGCKTKEKVTERMAETAHFTGEATQTSSLSSDSQSQVTATAQITQTSWSDSIVEKFHERIVTDSSGNVLWHETEHSKDHYVGKSHNKTNQSNSSQETATAQNVAITQEQKDSVYNGGVLQEVTVVKSKSCKWLRYVGLLALILVCAVIYKIKK